MKKLLVVLGLFALISFTAAAAPSGRVAETDIVTFIDGCPIQSYNYNDYTYVIAEDLRSYGFTVEWDGASRRLDISRAPLAFTSCAPPDLINGLRQQGVGLRVHPTDIQTYLNGQPITAYNVGGQTMINTDYLGRFGTCSYDNDSRTYRVDIIGRDVEGCETKDGKRGIFQGDTLLYGVEEQVTESRFGQSVTRRYGNFQTGQYVVYENSYMSPGERYEFHSGGSVVFAQSAPGFPFGLRADSQVTGGSTYCYLERDGSLYLVKQTTDAQARQFDGQLYADGSLIYQGPLYREELHMDFGDSRAFTGSSQSSNIAFWRAPAYCEEDGVIYYADQNALYYRGNVTNGLAHGTGRAYHPNSRTAPSGTVLQYDQLGAHALPQQDTCLMYSGGFMDGLYNGPGSMYADGALIVRGTWNYGVKEGAFTIYQPAGTNDQGVPVTMLLYQGNVSDGKRSGRGTSYQALGNLLYSGVCVEFDGTWLADNWHEGSWYVVGYNATENKNFPYLYYQGQFRYDGQRQYGAHYNPDGTLRERGWYVNWELVEREQS